MGDCFAQQIAADHDRYDLYGDVSVVARPRRHPYLDDDRAQVLLSQFSDEEEERLRLETARAKERLVAEYEMKLFNAIAILLGRASLVYFCTLGIQLLVWLIFEIYEGPSQIQKLIISRFVEERFKP